MNNIFYSAEENIRYAHSNYENPEPDTQIPNQISDEKKLVMDTYKSSYYNSFKFGEFFFTLQHFPYPLTKIPRVVTDIK